MIHGSHRGVPAIALGIVIEAAAVAGVGGELSEIP